MNVPRTASPKFSSVSLYGQHFSRYCTFYDFPTEFYLKISKCYIFFKTWLVAKETVFHHGGQWAHEDWLALGETRWWRSVFKFPVPYSPVLTKKSKCHKVFNFWQMTKSNSLYRPITNIFIIRLGWIGLKLWKRWLFEILAPIGYHVNNNEKQNRKNLKSENSDKTNKQTKKKKKEKKNIASHEIWSGSIRRFLRNLN